MRNALLFLLAALAVGCAAPVYDDPVPVMLNREKELRYRLAAAEQARQRLPGQDRYLAAVNQLLYDRGHPTELRIWAIDELVRQDEADFRRTMARRITLVSDWATLEHLFGLAVRRQWKDFSAVAVRSYARRAPGVLEADRLERKALEGLNPGQSVEQAIFNVFANADDQVEITQQVAAWELLNRLLAPAALMDLLAGAPERTPLVVDLKAAAADLGCIPANQEGVQWLFHLRDPGRRPWWDAARARVAGLAPAQRPGLELRHLPVLLAVPEGWLALSREQLLAQVGAAVDAGEHHLEAANYDGPPREHPHRFTHSIAKLTWGDLLTMKLLLAALADRALAAEFFRQADADLADTTTEYGGVLTRGPGGVGFSAGFCKPTQKAHDLKFIPSQEMIEQAYTGLAHYHFHAQAHRNREAAGPGSGDTGLANRLHLNFLVLTFVDRDRLNVDFYRPGNIVVDLGTIGR